MQKGMARATKKSVNDSYWTKDKYTPLKKMEWATENLLIWASLDLIPFLSPIVSPEQWFMQWRLRWASMNTSYCTVVVYALETHKICFLFQFKTKLCVSYLIVTRQSMPCLVIVSEIFVYLNRETEWAQVDKKAVGAGTTSNFLQASPLSFFAGI